MLSEQEWMSGYRDHIEPLYRYVSRRTGGEKELTEDVVQETWMRALQDWRRNGLPRVPMAWLTTVARNLLAGYYRRHRPSPLRSTDLDDHQLQVKSPETAALVQWGLARLRQKHVRLIEAFHFDGKRVEEIAQELGISERAAEGRLRRARLALRRQLSAQSSGGNQS